FTPLLRTTRQSGVLPSGQVIQRGFMGGGWNEARVHYPSGNDYVMAARVKGTIPGPPPKEGETAPSPTTINAVVVADVDMIADWVFDLRKRGMEDLNFDNVTFVLNSVDVLAGDESYVAIRKRRPRHRTLTRLEDATKSHRQRQLDEAKKAEDEAKSKLDEANAGLQSELKKLEERTDIDELQRQITIENKRQVAQRQLDVAKKNIEDEKSAAIERSRATLEETVRGIHARIKISTLLTAIPPLIIAVIVLLLRITGEKKVVQT
ncbi:MAG: ABC transporter, partial [Planctomycetes bacterium]|nr:ABC transporter [Planctomycetota bacterium]